MEEVLSMGKIPKIDSIEELAKFWDTHDLTDFEEELEEVKEPVFDLAAKRWCEYVLPPSRRRR